MGDKHLTSFKVENFKRFGEGDEAFEMLNIGQFNLIVGDNNVGKTSVLEALLVDEYAGMTRSRYLKVMREYRGITALRESFWRSFVRWDAWMKAPTTFTASTFGVIAIAPDKNNQSTSATDFLWTKNGITSEFDISNDSSLKMDGSFRLDGTALVHVPLIPFGLTHGDDIGVVYSAYIQTKKSVKKALQESLRFMLPTVSDIEISVALAEEATVVLWLEQNEFAVPLATLGDGTIKLFRILLNIVLHSREYLMIDEIDAGIHYSRMKDFWRTILHSARANDVQIFATTHNEECIRFFKEVLEEEAMAGFQADARIITLQENSKHAVYAQTREYEEFEHSLNHENELRGGGWQ